MSKLQETTMTTPEQLKEEFEKECELYQLFDNENYGDNLPYECQKLRVTNFWLNKIQSLLGEIEGRIEGEIKSIIMDEISRIEVPKSFPSAKYGLSWNLGKEMKERFRKSIPHITTKALSIIQEYKGKKI